jgi:hypothetical protein
MRKLIQTEKVELLENPKYYLALTSVFRNEARFLKEWIEFYKLMGVEHFYLYNRLSEDNYMQVLEPYIQSGLVDLTQLTYEPKNAVEWRSLVQNKAYLNASIAVKNEVEWLICLDADEFIYPLDDVNLRNVLRRYDDYASLSLHFRNFLSCGVQKIEDGELMIEKLLMAKGGLDEWVKTIVKPRYVAGFSSAHYPDLKNGYVQVRENYELFHGHINKNPIMDIIAINHYKYRDLEFFNSVKLSRISVAGNEFRKNFFMNENKCDKAVYDDKILKFAPLLRDAVFKADFNITSVDINQVFVGEGGDLIDLSVEQ